MSNLAYLLRMLRSRLPRLRQSQALDPSERRQMRDLHANTQKALADYRAGRISAEELRAWLAENDPAELLTRPSGLNE